MNPFESIQEKRHRLKALRQTTFACPSQWEGETADGDSVYIRLRHGVLSLEIGGALLTQINVGSRYDGVMDTPDMVRILSGFITMREE